MGAVSLRCSFVVARVTSLESRAGAAFPVTMLHLSMNSTCLNGKVSGNTAKTYVAGELSLAVNLTLTLIAAVNASVALVADVFS